MFLFGLLLLSASTEAAVTTMQRFLALPTLANLSPLTASTGNFENQHLTVLQLSLLTTATSTSSQAQYVGGSTSYDYYPQTDGGQIVVAFNDTFYSHKLWVSSSDFDKWTYASCTGEPTSNAAWTCHSRIVSTRSNTGDAGPLWLTSTITPTAGTMETASHIYTITVESIFWSKDATTPSPTSAINASTSKLSHSATTSSAGRSSSAQGNDAIRGWRGGGSFAISCIVSLFGVIVMAVL